MKFVAGFSIFFATILKFSACITYQFPDDFLFGTATAAYQIEGAWNVDGKLPSIWDTATHRKPSNDIADGSSGDDAAKSYYYFEQDIGLMKGVGFKAYRFSISWTRVMTRQMQINQAGIDYYNRLIDGLLHENITPQVTMYHWDLPQWLQDIGGWTSPEIVKYFEFYADILYTHFGDRVKFWITINEPAVFCGLGYGTGFHAPHINTVGSVGHYLCGHHALLSHATAYHLYQNKYKATQKGEVGINVNSGYSFKMYPNVSAEVIDRDMQFKIGHYAHPIFSVDGDYPKVMRDNIDRKSADEGRRFSRLPKFTEAQKNFVKGSSDFLTLNYYTSNLAAPLSDLPGANLAASDNEILSGIDDEWEQAQSTWLFSVPQGFHDHLVWIKNNYNNVPLYIAENGWSDAPLTRADEERQRYLKSHLAAMSRAISEEGCNVKGYAVWSLLDNFEWMMGYTERFGIFAVDFDHPNKTRIEKDSVQIFRDLMKNNYLDTDWFYVKRD